MNLQEQIFGWLAIVLIFIALLFQVLQTTKTNDVKSISLTTYIINTIGALIWVVHGIIGKAFHGGVENAIIVIFSGILFYYLLKQYISKSYSLLVSILLILVSLGLIIILIMDYTSPFIRKIPEWAQYLTGFTAGICTAFSFLPQILKVYRTKSEEGISFWNIISFGLAHLVLCIYWASRIGHDPLAAAIPGLIFAAFTLLFQVVLASYKIFKLAK